MVLDRNQLRAFAASGGDAEVLEEEPPKPGDFEEAGRFGVLLALLSQNAPYIDDLLDDLPGDVLRDPDGELDELDEQLLLDGVSKLPKALQAEIKFAQPIEWEDAEMLASALFDGVLDDQERLTGWLYHAADLI